MKIKRPKRGSKHWAAWYGYPKNGETIAVRELSIDIFCGCQDLNCQLDIDIPNRKESYGDKGEQDKTKTVRIVDLRRILGKHLRDAAKEIGDLPNYNCGQGFCHAHGRSHTNLNQEISMKDWKSIVDEAQRQEQ